MSDQEHQAITRSELVESLAEQFPQLLPRDVELAVKTLLDTMTQALAEGKRIELRGVGSFVLHHRPARTGRNPKSGEKVLTLITSRSIKKLFLIQVVRVPNPVVVDLPRI
ncbi:MAG: hypothetical protein RIQ30_969 [Pseudomonadota bacterium]